MVCTGLITQHAMTQQSRVSSTVLQCCHDIWTRGMINKDLHARAVTLAPNLLESAMRNCDAIVVTQALSSTSATTMATSTRSVVEHILETDADTLDNDTLCRMERELKEAECVVTALNDELDNRGIFAAVCVHGAIYATDGSQVDDHCGCHMW